MTPRPSAIGDLRFAGTIAAGLVAGTLGLGALAAPLVGWKDWPSALTGEAATPSVKLASPKVKAEPRRGREGGQQVPRSETPLNVLGIPSPAGDGTGTGTGTGAGNSGLAVFVNDGSESDTAGIGRSERESSGTERRGSDGDATGPFWSALGQSFQPTSGAASAPRPRVPATRPVAIVPAKRRSPIAVGRAVAYVVSVSDMFWHPLPRGVSASCTRSISPLGTN